LRRDDHIFIAPSGVQKERMVADDLFVLTPKGDVIRSPPEAKRLKASQCTPLFFECYLLRDAGACIHTHSQHAVMCTLLWEKEFKITHQEMIKGIKRGKSGEACNYYDTLVVPIIENTAREMDLKDSLSEAINAYPDANAVLVRRHGVYVWGSTWQQAKGMAESYDYLFELAVKMKLAGLDPAEVPRDSQYRGMDGKLVLCDDSSSK
jgi:methylthioribulose-1-phosphate dehydratase